MKQIFSRVAAIALIVAPFAVINSTAQATVTDSFTPTGTSWVSVPMADRHYMNEFGQSNGSGYDDYSVGLVPTGATCTSNSVTATAGDLVPSNGNGPSVDCVDSNSQSINQVDAIPLGFNVNFFGTTYSSGWLNTNGGLTFDAPTSAYNRTLFNIAANQHTTGIFPLAMDLFHVVGQSNLWYAHTTIAGKSAFVASWETYSPCCTNSTSDGTASFQLVIIDQGSGNFDAWFNYDNFTITGQGYHAWKSYVDLHAGVTANSNVVTVRNLTNFPTGCTSLGTNYYSFANTTMPDWLNNDVYAQIQSEPDRTLALFSDSNCTTPINVTPQVAGDYLELQANTTDSIRSAAVGWDNYNTTTGVSSSTEFFSNQSVLNLVNADPSRSVVAGSSPLDHFSLNTTVPGRLVIGQRGGVTVGDPTAVGAVEPLVPTSGSNEISTGSAQVIESDGTTTAVPLVLSAGGSKATVSDGGMTMTMAGQPDSASGTIAVSPTTGVEVSGTGFKANSEVNVWVFSAATHLGAVTTDAHGNFKHRFAVPNTLAAGIHTLQAQGKNPAGHTRAMAAKISIGKASLAHTGLNTGLIGGIALVFMALGGLAMFEIRRRFYN